MSTKNTITATATAIAVMEEALAATRLEHTSVSTARIETKIAAFAEVVRNTRRKMTHPTGFDWALHSSFKVVAITDTYLKVEVTKGRDAERSIINVPRGDLSLSTWQVTGLIRRMSAERLLEDLNATVKERQQFVATSRKEVEAAEQALAVSEQALSDASAAVERRRARMQRLEVKRAASRARRKAADPAPEAGAEAVLSQ